MVGNSLEFPVRIYCENSHWPYDTWLKTEITYSTIVES